MNMNSEELEALDRHLFARNMRGLRRLQRITQTELAKRAGVALTTVYSAEKGLRLRIGTLRKIAEGLSSSFDSLAFRKLKIKTSDQLYVLHQAHETIWFGQDDRRRQTPEDNLERIQDPAERSRLGHVGLVAGFATLPSFVMMKGPGLTLMELFGGWNGPLNAGVYRDSVLYCLRGPVIVTIREEKVRIAQGESIGYSSIDLTRLEPELPLSPKDPPALLLWVGADRIGKVS
jgi:transcriptional regulator with XRE-family HTH domain